MPTSEQKQKLLWLEEQRLLYRLALGQPNQEDSVELLQQKGLSLEEMRAAMIGLSTWFDKD